MLFRSNLDNAFEVLDELGVRRRLMRMLCHIQNSPTTNTYLYMCVRKLERERELLLRLIVTRCVVEAGAVDGDGG